MTNQEILLKVNSAKTDKEFENACNLIENADLRKKALNVIWYSMTLEQDKKMVTKILNH